MASKLVGRNESERIRNLEILNLEAEPFWQDEGSIQDRKLVETRKYCIIHARLDLYYSCCIIHARLE